MSLSYGALGWSAVCDYGIALSYSLIKIFTYPCVSAKFAKFLLEIKFVCSDHFPPIINLLEQFSYSKAKEL